MNIFNTLVAISLLTGAPALAADQFDLICKGVRQGYPENHPASRRYRVDLAAKQWCAGDDVSCAVRPIAEILPDVIWFEHVKPQFRGDMEIIHYAGRTDGKWVWILGPMSTEGTCTPAPFTSFPAPPTKF